MIGPVDAGTHSLTLTEAAIRWEDAALAPYRADLHPALRIVGHWEPRALEQIKPRDLGLREGDTRRLEPPIPVLYHEARPVWLLGLGLGC